jgi:hypothetical protein
MKTWNYGTDKGLDRRLKLVGFNFIEPDEKSAGIEIKLKDQLLSPTGDVVSETNANYSVIKGQISYDIDGYPLPKKDTNGDIIYEDMVMELTPGEEGYIEGESTFVTRQVPAKRDNAYENIIYYIDNKIFTVYELIDSGVKERFKLV